jgi:hypothetical protein
MSRPFTEYILGHTYLGAYYSRSYVCSVGTVCRVTNIPISCSAIMAATMTLFARALLSAHMDLIGVVEIATRTCM